MQRRTSPLEVLIRFWAVAFVFALCPYGFLFLMIGAISLPFLAFIALVVTILFNGIQWVGHQIVFRTLLSDDEQVQKFLRDGGDPWFNLSCPWPFNPDSEQLRMTAEPEIWHCSECSGPNTDIEQPCQHCGFGRWHCGRCDALLDDQFSPCPACGNNPFGERGTCE